MSRGHVTLERRVTLALQRSTARIAGSLQRPSAPGRRDHPQNMAAIATNQRIPYEIRIDLAIQAIQSSQVPSIRAAATLYDVTRAILQNRLHVNNRKLTATEEQALLNRIISLDERGFSPTLPFVRRMADLLLSQRAPGSAVGKNWLTRFQRHDVLILERATIAKYGRHTNKAADVKAAKVTVIEGINATGWALPSTIIFEGKVHQSNWYRTGIPSNWVIGLSEKGWTNNELGFKWLTEVFDKHSRGRAVGNHFTPEFDDFCKKNSIVWLCYPPHSTHLLQALDFGCFLALKNSYIELGTFHIDKTDFLVLYHQAHRITFTEKTIKNAFKAVGTVPYDPQRVLSRLNVRTPSPLLQPTTLDPQGSGSQLLPKTPHNITELEAQVKALQQHRTRAAQEQASPTDQAPFCRRKMSDSEAKAKDRGERGMDMRRSYVAHGGVLAVEKGLQLAEEKANGGKGICRLPGHNARSGRGNKDSIHVVKYVIATVGALFSTAHYFAK
ncbi:DDE superfamily endonuclease [Hirsutella rhossiliensis]